MCNLQCLHSSVFTFLLLKIPLCGTLSVGGGGSKEEEDSLFIMFRNLYSLKSNSFSTKAGQLHVMFCAPFFPPLLFFSFLSPFFLSLFPSNRPDHGLWLFWLMLFVNQPPKLFLITGVCLVKSIVLLTTSWKNQLITFVSKVGINVNSSSTFCWN